MANKKKYFNSRDPRSEKLCWYNTVSDVSPGVLFGKWFWHCIWPFFWHIFRHIPTFYLTFLIWSSQGSGARHAWGPCVPRLSWHAFCFLAKVSALTFLLGYLSSVFSLAACLASNLTFSLSSCVAYSDGILSGIYSDISFWQVPTFFLACSGRCALNLIWSSPYGKKESHFSSTSRDPSLAGG